jgi:hypothetical protein
MGTFRICIFSPARVKNYPCGMSVYRSRNKFPRSSRIAAIEAGGAASESTQWSVVRVIGAKAMGGLAALRHDISREPSIKRRPDAKIAKHKGMIEKRIERYFRESEELGWDYDAFVASVLEILTVLHHRNRMR